MNIFDIQGKYLSIDTASPVISLHDTLRYVIEHELQGWRVIRIFQENDTVCEPIAATRKLPHPVYIRFITEVSFDVICVEDAPLEKVVEGITIQLPVQRLRCKMRMTSDNMLMITEARIEETRP